MVSGDAAVDLFCYATHLAELGHRDRQGTFRGILTHIRDSAWNGIRDVPIHRTQATRSGGMAMDKRKLTGMDDGYDDNLHRRVDTVR